MLSCNGISLHFYGVCRPCIGTVDGDITDVFMWTVKIHECNAYCTAYAPKAYSEKFAN